MILSFVYSSTRSTEMSESFEEAERLGAVLGRAGDEAGAHVAEAWAAFLLFSMGRAGEAARRAGAVVDLGPGDEIWRRQARQSRGSSLVWGPAPVEEAIAAIEAQAGPKWDPGAYRGMARLRVLQGRFAEARELNARARATYEDLGNRQQVMALLTTEGEVEYYAGNPAEGARLIRESYDGLTATGDRAFASTVAVNLGEVLLDLHRDDEAWEYGRVGRETSSTDDVMSQAGGRAVQARVLSRRGDHQGAEELAREAVAIISQTDYLDLHAGALVHLGHVLQEAGKPEEAIASAREAMALYDRKGATFFREKTQRLIDAWGV
jgi:tetratricopeptide (TPR) repeat protein